MDNDIQALNPTDEVILPIDNNNNLSISSGNNDDGDNDDDIDDEDKNDIIPPSQGDESCVYQDEIADLQNQILNKDEYIRSQADSSLQCISQLKQDHQKLLDDITTRHQGIIEQFEQEITVLTDRNTQLLQQNEDQLQAIEKLQQKHTVEITTQEQRYQETIEQETRKYTTEKQQLQERLQHLTQIISQLSQLMVTTTTAATTTTTATTTTATTTAVVTDSTIIDNNLGTHLDIDTYNNLTSIIVADVEHGMEESNPDPNKASSLDTTTAPTNAVAVATTTTSTPSNVPVEMNNLLDTAVEVLAEDIKCISNIQATIECVHCQPYIRLYLAYKNTPLYKLIKPSLSSSSSLSSTQQQNTLIITSIDAIGSQKSIDNYKPQCLLLYLAFNPQIKVNPDDLVSCFNAIKHSILKFRSGYGLFSLIYIYIFMISHLTTVKLANNQPIIIHCSTNNEVNGTTTTATGDDTQFLAYAAHVAQLFNPFQFFCDYMDKCLEQWSPISDLHQSISEGDDAQSVLGSFCYLYASIPGLRSSMLQGLLAINSAFADVYTRPHLQRKLQEDPGSYKRRDAVFRDILNAMLESIQIGTSFPWKFTLGHHHSMLNARSVAYSILPQSDLLNYVAFYHNQWIKVNSTTPTTGASVSGGAANPPDVNNVLHDILSTVEYHKGIILVDNYIQSYTNPHTFIGSSGKLSHTLNLQKVHTQYDPAIDGLVNPQNYGTITHFEMVYPRVKLPSYDYLNKWSNGDIKKIAPQFDLDYILQFTSSK